MNTRRSSTCTSGRASPGQPANKVARIDYDYLHEFDVRQANSAVEYVKKHAKDAKPFFMDVNFMKMHNPNIPAKAFIGNPTSATIPTPCWSSIPTSAK